MNEKKELVTYFKLNEQDSEKLARELNISANGDFEYDVIDDDSVEIKRYIGNDKNVVIPDFIDGRRVVSVHFVNESIENDVLTITISESVKKIKSFLLFPYKNLQRIDVSDNNTDFCSIDGVLFSKDKSSLLFFPQGREGMYRIPNGVRNIEYSAFGDCENVTEILIPESVEEINSDFRRCKNLDNLHIIGNNACFCSVDGVLFSKNKQKLIKVPNSRRGEYIVPETVTEIGDDAFSSCALTKVKLPESVVSIGDYAFSESNLKELTIPNNVISIGDSAFYASPIEEITIPNSVVSMGEEVFDGCYFLNKVTILGRMTAISSGAFLDCWNLTEVSIPDSVTSIEECAFFDCFSLREITIPENVTNIEDRAFANSGLREITIPDRVTNIGRDAFQDCENLRSISIPKHLEGKIDVNDDVTVIVRDNSQGIEHIEKLTRELKNSAEVDFEYDVLDDGSVEITRYTGNDKNVVIPDSINGKRVVSINEFFESINNLSRRENNDLWTVTISRNVAQIGENSFSACENLERIDVVDDNPEFCSVDGVVFSKDKSRLVLVPKSREGIYIISNGVATVEKGAFSECHNITDVFISESVRTICVEDFDSCSNLKSLYVVGDNPCFSSVDGVLFSKNKQKLLQVPNGRVGEYVVPETVTEISDDAFSGCSGLTKIKLPEGLSLIGDYAFYECSSLTEIVIPNGVTSIGECAFIGCSSLTEIKIPDSVTSIGEYAFVRCNGLTEINLPNSVTSIGKYAFDSCEYLRIISIPKHLEGKIDVNYYVTVIVRDSSQSTDNLTEISTNDALDALN